MKTLKKVIIAGGRDFDDYEKLSEICDKIFEAIVKHSEEDLEFEIVSGGARGADKLGEIYALDRGYSVKRFPANWDKHGKSAGFRRNAEMSEYGDILIAFWDNRSRGTKNMIDLANARKMPTITIGYVKTHGINLN